MRLFVFGLGYSARAFVEKMRDRLDWVGGTTRSSEKAESLCAAGIEPFLFDGEAPGDGIAEALSKAAHVLVSIAPGEAGDPVLAHHRADIAAARPEWIGYLSTIGVYGDHDGAWIDEETETVPRSERSKQRLVAENAWLDLARETDIPVGIFRLSGIYGPGKNAFVNLEKGTARRLVKPGQVFNRIHVEDIAGVLEAAATAPATRIYNVTDDEPCPAQDVVEYTADLIGLPCPPDIDFETADLSPMARSFYAENKRASNARVKEELGYRFRHPTYRDALQHMLADGWK
ncbi:SDR family oxidoreductase [Breoghania sp.]|uniref:SDR family oxidoreductase n=1 Tax=Breoghania sp. TaxID=2065378 RepID=UPI002633B030|nr:SDR family oxidoreductase [Breoghania sp.]MDJ0932839.1 SDR family oxidoreductase [Breoghania sp.]